MQTHTRLEMDSTSKFVQVRKAHLGSALRCNHPAGLMKELQSAQKQISDLRSEVARAQLPLLTAKAETLASGAKMLAVQVDGMDAKSLQVSLLSGYQLVNGMLYCALSMQVWWLYLRMAWLAST